MNQLVIFLIFFFESLFWRAWLLFHREANSLPTQHKHTLLHWCSSYPWQILPSYLRYQPYPRIWKLIKVSYSYWNDGFILLRRVPCTTTPYLPISVVKLHFPVSNIFLCDILTGLSKDHGNKIHVNHQHIDHLLRHQTTRSDFGITCKLENSAKNSGHPSREG